MYSILHVQYFSASSCNELILQNSSLHRLDCKNCEFIRKIFLSEKKLFPSPRTRYSRRQKRLCLAHTQYGWRAYRPSGGVQCSHLQTVDLFHLPVLTEPSSGSLHSYRIFKKKKTYKAPYTASQV